MLGLNLLPPNHCLPRAAPQLPPPWEHWDRERAPDSTNPFHQVLGRRSQQDTEPGQTFHNPEMNISPFPGGTVSHPHPCFREEQNICTQLGLWFMMNWWVLHALTSWSQVEQKGKIPQLRSTLLFVCANQAALGSFKAPCSPVLTRPTHHAAQSLQAPLPAPPGDERTCKQLHDALQIASKRALNSCSSRRDATSSRSLSTLPPGAPPEFWQPSGSFGSLAPEPPAAFWADQVGSAAASDAVPTAPLRPDLQLSPELASTMAATAAGDSESLS